MKKFITKTFLAMALMSTFSACNNYMDIVPDNVATIDYAFRLRSTAERFLFTCYSYMPLHSGINENAAFLAGDELWLPPTRSEEHTSELQSLMRISYAVFCLKTQIIQNEAPQIEIQYTK